MIQAAQRFLRAMKRGAAAALLMAGGLACVGQASAATAVTDLAVYKDVDLSNSHDPRISKFYVGDTVTYRLQVVNNGPTAVSGAKLTDVAEPGLVGLTWTCSVVRGPAACPAASGTGLPNFTIPSLGSGSELRITYTAKVTAVDGQLTNTAEIQPPTGVTDSNPANNKDSVYICTFDTSLPSETTLLITKTSNGPWTAGQSGATYTLNVKNNSNFATSGTVTVKDLMPTGILPASTSFSPASGWQCNTAGQLVTCTSSTPIEGTRSVDLVIPLTVGASAAATVTNRASVGGGGDPDPIPDPSTCAPGDQCATTTTTVTGTTPPTTPPACTQLYALRNTGPGSLSGLSIVRLDENTNTFGTRVTDIPKDGYYNVYSATLALSPDGRRFFVADDNYRLRVYDTTTGSWSQGAALVGAQSRIVRMAVMPDGTGYAMDSSTNFWRFQTTSPYGTTSLGKITSVSSGAPAFQQNGDFLASSDGKLYMISSVSGAARVDLWLITPESRSAEYLGSFSDPSSGKQYNGFAATPNGLFAASNDGDLVKIDPANVNVTRIGANNQGSTDLASCYYPVLAPKIIATKTVKKVAGAAGPNVQPGDTLEYTIVVRNGGTMPAGGATFRDILPIGTTYVAGSARVNGFTTTILNGSAVNLSGAAYPFAQPVGICSQDTAACTTQVLKVDTTPGTLDREAVVTFRVTVNNPFTNDPSQVSNQAVITYVGGGETPTDDPTTPTPGDPTVTPVKLPAKLTAVKTVQNITRNGPVGNSSAGNPGDVLEYCIKTTNVGGLGATNIRFGDNVPANTSFLAGAYGAGQDIRITLNGGSVVYYTAAQDTDGGALVNGRVTVDGGSLVLGGGQTFTVCFRATIG